MRPATLTTLVAALWMTLPAAGQSKGEAASPELLARVGRYVEGYFSGARTIVSRETVRVQPLDANLQPAPGEWRQLVYEVRVEWDPARPGAPSVTRQELSSGGRVANLRRTDSECFDLQPASEEPLAMLLPALQRDYTFTSGGAPRGRRPVAIIEFRQTASTPPTVTWTGNCAAIAFNGATRGRAWVHAGTGAVERIDEWIERPFPFSPPPSLQPRRDQRPQTIDRLETSIRYEPVTFRNPDETVMLPRSVRTLQVVHNGAVPRMLTLHSFDRHRRFVTAGRIVK